MLRRERNRAKFNLTLKGTVMIVTTTPSVEGYRISGYYGVVFGEVITGINFLRDFGAGIRNIVGGRSEGYEQELLQARTEALQELEQRAASMGAHAVVGVDMDYEGPSGKRTYRGHRSFRMEQEVL